MAPRGISERSSERTQGPLRLAVFAPVPTQTKQAHTGKELEAYCPHAPAGATGFRSRLRICSLGPPCSGLLPSLCCWWGAIPLARARAFSGQRKNKLLASHPVLRMAPMLEQWARLLTQLTRLYQHTRSENANVRRKKKCAMAKTEKLEKNRLSD